jgi:predicted RND superfamily exporter protein
MPGFIVNWSARKPTWILVIAGLGFCLSGLFAVRAEPWFPLYQNLPEHNDVRRAHRIIEDKFGGYLRLWFVIENKAGDNNLARIAAVTNAIERTAPDYAVISLATIAKWSGSTGLDPGAETMEKLPPTLLSQIGYGNPEIDRVLALVPEPMHDRATRDRYDRMVSAAIEAGADGVVGFPVILREGALSVISDLTISLATACVLSVGLLAWAFQSIRLIPILLIPNLMPLTVAMASLSVLNSGQLNPAAAFALTVAFGIALDDTIHFLNRYMLERDNGEDIGRALDNTIRDTGRVMMLTTLLVSTGMAFTALSDFSTVRLFGAMLILILVCALIADLLVLPALIRKGSWLWHRLRDE